jgi:2-oxo-3-hexenedioate decarboxylase
VARAVSDSRTARALARELATAYAVRQPIAVPPSAREGGLDLTTAYAVAAELDRLRRAAGHLTVGRKVGFAHKALWRVLGLETLVWGSIYDDTVRYADQNEGRLDVSAMWAPKIEPEIVFKMRTGLGTGAADAAAALGAVEWLALGFEIIDCPFPDGQFKPVDFVAAYGFHAALVVGASVPIKLEMLLPLVDRLAAFKVTLSKDGNVVTEGSGRNVLRNPVLCLSELAAALARRADARPLAAGELVSSGTLTESQRLGPGETWTAAVDGLDLPALTLRT